MWRHFCWAISVMDGLLCTYFLINVGLVPSTYIMLYIEATSVAVFWCSQQCHYIQGKPLEYLFLQAARPNALLTP